MIPASDVAPDQLPGIPTHFRVFDMASAPFALDEDRLPSAYLGAIGPSLGDFISSSDSGQPVPDSSAYWKVWEQVLAPVFGYEADKKPPADAAPERSLL